jgi:H+/Cl- antiporter ClcA
LGSPPTAAAGPASQQPSPREFLRLVLLGGLVGIPAALVAALFLAFVHEAQHWLWTDLPDALGDSEPPWYLVVGLPLVGALLVAFARRALPGDGGHNPLDGLALGPVPLAYAPGVALAAAATLIFGIVLGPEAPVIALGAIVAGGMTWFARLDDQSARIMAMAGSFAAISALFGGPLVGGVLLLEAGVGLGAAIIPAMLPGFVAAAVGYVIFLGLGDWAGLNAPGLTVPDLPLYDGTSIRDLAIAIVVGVALAILLAVIRRYTRRLAAIGPRRLGLVGMLLAGGLAVGLIAIVADALGASSQDVLFSGQASIPALITETSTGIVVVLIVAKALGYAVSLASGFRGGPIFPALFLGVGVATLPVIWFDMSPTYAIAIGAAAGMAAEAKLILSGMLFAGLLVGTAGLDAISGVVLAAAAAWIVTTALERQSPPSGDGQTQPQT